MRFPFFPAIAAAIGLLATVIAEDLLLFDWGLYSLEPSEALSLGYTTKLVGESEWRSMNTTEFASFRAIIIGDPGPGTDPSQLQFLVHTKEVWGPAIDGNIIIHGADQSNHYKTVLIDNSIKFAAAGVSASGGSQTGFYLSLSQYYDDVTATTVEALSYFGEFQVRGDFGCYDDSHIVASSPAIDTLTDADLSNWGCSVHEAFSTYPSNGTNGFQALAIANNVIGEGTQNYANGYFGLPYIISRGATPSGCGDGHWDESLGEECDDGNTVDGDGCSKSCKCESGLPNGNGTCAAAVDTTPTANTTIPDSSNTTIPANSNTTIPANFNTTTSASHNTTIPASSNTTIPNSSNTTIPDSSNTTSTDSTSATPTLMDPVTSSDNLTLVAATTTPISTTTSPATSTTSGNPSNTPSTTPSTTSDPPSTPSTTDELLTNTPASSTFTTTPRSSAGTAASQVSTIGVSTISTIASVASAVVNAQLSTGVVSEDTGSQSKLSSTSPNTVASIVQNSSTSAKASDKAVSSANAVSSVQSSTQASQAQTQATLATGSSATAIAKTAGSKAVTSNANKSGVSNSASVAVIAASTKGSVVASTVSVTDSTPTGSLGLKADSKPSFTHQVVALTTSASGSALAEYKTVDIQTAPTGTSTGTGTGGGGGPSDSSSSGSDNNDNSELKLSGPLDRIDYFNGLYLCVIVTVLFKSLWGFVFASTKMIEPFYQLSSEGGASAQESLLSDFLSSGLSWGSLRNILRQHWVMSLTSAVYVISSINMAVASESMTIRSQNRCTNPADPALCALEWIVEVKVVRALEAFLALTALMIFLRIFLNFDRSSGVFTYPCNIAAMAALLSNPTVIGDFRKINPQADSEDISKALAGNYYTLGEYEISPGTVRHGLKKVVSSENLQRRQSGLPEHDNVPNTEANNNKTTNSLPISYRHLPWDSILHIFFLGVHISLFGIFLTFQLHNNAAQIFKGKFGTRFLLTIVTTLLGEQWKRLEREVRVMTPYRKLYKKTNATSQDLIAMSLHGIPIKTFPYAVWHGNYFHAWVAFVAIISDLLIIGVVGIPYNFGVVQDVSFVSSNACLVILGIMMVTVVLIALWRWSNPKMPRKPDTLANIWIMMCASRMLDDFEGLERKPCQAGELARRMEGKRYWFGRQIGVDGKERAMVDVDDMEYED